MNKRLRITNARNHQETIVLPPAHVVEYTRYDVIKNWVTKTVSVPAIVCPYCGEQACELFDDCIHCDGCWFFHSTLHKRNRKNLKAEYPAVYATWNDKFQKDKLHMHEDIFQDNLHKTYSEINEPSVEDIVNMNAATAIVEVEKKNEHTRPLHFEALDIGDFEFTEEANLVTSHLTFEGEEIMFGINVTVSEVKETPYAEFGIIEFYNKEQVDNLLKKYSYQDLEYFIKTMWNFYGVIEYV